MQGCFHAIQAQRDADDYADLCNREDAAREDAEERTLDAMRIGAVRELEVAEYDGEIEHLNYIYMLLAANASDTELAAAARRLKESTLRRCDQDYWAAVDDAERRRRHRRLRWLA